MKKIILSLSIAVLTGMTPTAVNAGMISGVHFNTQIEDEEVTLQLQGAAVKRVAFFKAFAAGYYKDDRETKNALGDFSKRIEVAYFVTIPAYKMNDFTVKSMKENVTKEEFQQISSEVDLMKRYFVDLEPGDRYSLTFIPGIGTKFVHNNQLVGVIEGRTFAKALFSTWLGQKPFDKKLKERILGSDNTNRDNKDMLALNTKR